jgi:hypothetical protein
MRASLTIAAALLSLRLISGLNILTFGDSHSKWDRSIFDVIIKEVPSIVISGMYIGAKLMYSLGRDMRDYVSDLPFSTDTIIVFSAGEVDVRSHFDKHVANGDYNALAKGIVFAYEKFLLKNRDALPGISIWVQGIVPPTDQNYREDYPYIGSKKDRIFYTLLMNHWLRYICERNGFVFLDMFSDYADDMGGLIPEYSDGEVHIAIYTRDTKELIAQKIREHLANKKKTREEDEL